MTRADPARDLLKSGESWLDLAHAVRKAALNVLFVTLTP